MIRRLVPDAPSAGRPRAGAPGPSLAAAVLLAAGAALSAGCGGPSPEEHFSFPPEAAAGVPKPAAIPVDEMVFEVGPPPFIDPEIFPCTQCHDKDLPANPVRRTLGLAHQEIVLHHDEEHRWCLDCHDAENRDMLRLANGSLVPFTASYRLCGQCHGDKYREWRAGVHGRRTGSWDGKKQYLLCVNCHYSHEPRFKPLAPKPPPVTPGSIR